MTIFCVPPCGGGGGGAGPPGPPGDTRFFLTFTAPSGVPAGGTQYLSLANVMGSQTGALLTADGAIRGISATVDQVDLTRTYSVQVLSDPSGAGGTGPTIEASVALPANTLRVRDRTFNNSVSGLQDLGVRLVQTFPLAPSASTFEEIVVIVEVSIP